ncbi:MAG: MFS transporter [Spirochaetaceae bacterium]|nr:MAG: MFS transporter [Spirochaetaceae bacterium]
MTKDEQQIAYLNFAGHGLVHLFEGVIPPLIPLLMLEFGASYFEMGLVVSVFTYLFGLGSLPAGWLTDLFGSRNLITIYLLVAGALSIAVITVSGYLGYMLVAAAVGLGASIYHPAGSTMISQEVSERGRAFGIYGMGGSLGIATAPVLSAFLGSEFGWRVPHIVFGIAGLAVGAWSMSIRRRSVGPRRTVPRFQEREHATSKLGMLLLLYISFALLGMAYKGLTTFLPAYMSQSAFADQTTFNPVTLGGAIATTAFLFGLLGQYVGGVLSDRVFPEYFYAVTTLAAGVFAFLMAFTTGILLVLLAVTQAFFAFTSQPVQNLLVARHLSRKRQGLGYGMKFFMLFGVGSIAAAFAGYLADRLGLSSVFAAMSFLYAAAATVAFLMGTAARRGRFRQP